MFGSKIAWQQQQQQPQKEREGKMALYYYFDKTDVSQTSCFKHMTI